jgi:hypothetical protein
MCKINEDHPDFAKAKPPLHRRGTGNKSSPPVEGWHFSLKKNDGVV